MTDNTVRLTYQQYRAVRRLVHSCCNYDQGNCLLLDDGEECVCPQAISYPLVPGRCAAAGRGTVRRSVAPALCWAAALPGVQADFHPAQAQHPLLPRLCRKTCQAEQAGLGQEKEGWCVEKVPSENPLISRLSKPLSIGGLYVSILNP